jgi:dienelactone hydrolase
LRVFLDRSLRLGLAFVCMYASAACAGGPDWRGWHGWASAVPDLEDRGPFHANSFETTVSNPATGSELPVVVWYPDETARDGPSAGPFPGIVFSHGFLANPHLYAGNGQHLASWGYIVAMPWFASSELAGRVSDAARVLTYLEIELDAPGTPFQGMVDAGRLGAVGHSLGGLTALVLAARDDRVRAVVATDPVNPPGFAGFTAWNSREEGKSLSAPALLIGAPAQTCNYYGSYERFYPHLAPPHKAKLVVPDANHCDFMLTGNAAVRDACYRLCRGEYQRSRTVVAARYTVAWLNYYLLGELSSYELLYGESARDDQEAGRVLAQVDTAPLGVTATATGRGIEVAWSATDLRLVAGYNIYRRSEGHEFSSLPHASVDTVSSYTDTTAHPGGRYHYVVRSRDAEGNEHEPSIEATAALPDD